MQICDDESGSTEMSCLAPFINITIDSPVTARLGLLMDGVQSLLDLNRTITVHPTPTITPFDTVQMYGQSSSFQLTISVWIKWSQLITSNNTAGIARAK